MDKETLKSLIRQQINHNPQLSKPWVCLECEIRWKDCDEDETERAIIRVVPSGTDTEKLDTDDEITYYVNDIEEFIGLCEEDNGSDFILTDYFYSYM